jgi:hypothetical protein
MNIYLNNTFFKTEKQGLVYVNSRAWANRVSKNLMLELFEFLRPKKIEVRKVEEKKSRRSSAILQLRRKNSLSSFESSEGSNRGPNIVVMHSGPASIDSGASLGSEKGQKYSGPGTPK